MRGRRLCRAGQSADRLPPETGQNGGTEKVPSRLIFRALGAPSSLPGRPPQSEP